MPYCRTSGDRILFSIPFTVTKLVLKCPVCDNDVGTKITEEGIFFKNHNGRWRTNAAGIPQIGSQSIPGMTEEKVRRSSGEGDYARARSMANHPSNLRSESKNESTEAEE